MSPTLALFIDYLLKAGALFLAFNEIRGLMLAGPVLYGIYQAGGTAIAIWMGICSLGGIALSVVVPLFAARKFQQFAKARLQSKAQGS